MRKSQSFRHDYGDNSYELAMMTGLMKKTNESLNQIYDGLFSNQTKPTATRETAKPRLARQGSFVTDLSNMSRESKKLFEKKVQENEPIADTENLDDFDDINELADTFLLNFRALGSDELKSHQAMEERTNLVHRENTITKLLKESVLNDYTKRFGTLEWCRSLVVNMNGDVICVDSLGHRILVFNAQLIFKYEFGKQGVAANEFDEPVDAVLDQIGRLFVADKNNGRVEVFDEKKLMKQVRIQVNTFGNSQSKAATKGNNVKAFKAGSFYKHTSSVALGDRPIKLSSTPYACLVACSTESGRILLINEQLDLVAYVSMKQPFTQFDLKCMCLNESGTELINLKRVQNDEYLLKFFAIDSLLAPSDRKLRRLRLARKCRLEKNYLPGIDMGQARLLKLSTDTSHLVVYDALNLNLLEFDMNGSFRRMLVKATHNLTNCLAFDYNKQLLFNSNRQHLITSEYELNPRYKFKYRDNAFKGNFELIAAIVRRNDEELELNENYLLTNELRRTKTIEENKYLFKLKIYSF